MTCLRQLVSNFRRTLSLIWFGRSDLRQTSNVSYVSLQDGKWLQYMVPGTWCAAFVLGTYLCFKQTLSYYIFTLNNNNHLQSLRVYTVDLPLTCDCSQWVAPKFIGTIYSGNTLKLLLRVKQPIPFSIGTALLPCGELTPSQSPARMMRSVRRWHVEHYKTQNLNPSALRRVENVNNGRSSKNWGFALRGLDWEIRDTAPSRKKNSYSIRSCATV